MKPTSLYSQELTDLSLVKVLNNDVFVFLPQDISQSFDVEWYGKFITIDGRNFAHGKGKLVFIRKSDGYRSIPYSVNAEEGYITSNLVLKSDQFYKCLDENCELKSLKLVLRYIQGEKITEEVVTFEGELSINGDVLVPKLGKLESKNFIYEGEFDKGEITGFGKFCFKSERVTSCDKALIIQEGFWERGRFLEGYLKTAYSDGAVYEGWSVNGIPDGWGKVLWSDGSRYVGEFLEGKKHGKGFYLFPDGSWYRGEYKNDLKDGEGELYIKPLDVYYIGQFKAGKIQGWGELYIGNEFVYIGSFENNLPNGSGYLIDKSGNTYEVIVNNGNILFVNSTSQKLSLYQLFSSEAYAFSIPSLSDVVNLFSKKVQEVADWVEKNKTHLINAVKGCIAGGFGGAISGAAAGAVVGAVTGGNVVAGAVVGGGIGFVNGCFNQAEKAFEKDGNYTLRDAFQSFKEELFSVENFAFGALGEVGAIGVGAKAAEKVAELPPVRRAFSQLERFFSKNVRKAFRYLCKKKIVKRFLKRFCEEGRPSYPDLTLTLLSWNLNNFSPEGKKEKDRELIYDFLESRDEDIILLQEVLKANDERWNGFWKNLEKETKRELIVSEPKNTKTDKRNETFVFLVKKNKFSSVRLVDKEVLSNLSLLGLKRKPSIVCLQMKSSRVGRRKKGLRRRNSYQEYCDIAVVNVHVDLKMRVFGIEIKKKRTKNTLRMTRTIFSLASVVQKLKRKFSPKIIIIGGDFNMEPDILEKIGKKIGLYRPVIYDITMIGKDRNRYDNFLIPFWIRGASGEVIYSLICQCSSAKTSKRVCKEISSYQEVEQMETFRECYKEYVSDHFPITAKLQWIF
ncbi:hypothetical protein [Desulfurobacterium crinifex]